MSDLRGYVSGGHVYCQVYREDRDIEQCFGCSRLKELNEKNSPPYVLCEAKDIPEPAQRDPLFVEWWYQHHRRGR